MIEIMYHILHRLICPSAKVTLDELHTQLTYQIYCDRWLLYKTD